VTRIADREDREDRDRDDQRRDAERQVERAPGPHSSPTSQWNRSARSAGVSICGVDAAVIEERRQVARVDPDRPDQADEDRVRERLERAVHRAIQVGQGIGQSR
jgi:hypothetical protein